MSVTSIAGSKLRVAFAVVILFALHAPVLAEPVPLPTVEATADAHYQGLTPGPDGELHSSVADGPAIAAEARSLQSVGGEAAPPYAWDDSDGRARASLPGTFGAYARAGGYSPGVGTYGEGTFATATARTVTNWEVAGSAGGSTLIDMAISLDGFIYAAEYAGEPPAPVVAEVGLLINLITAEGTTNLLEASGRVDLQAGGGLEGYFLAIDDGSSAPWFSSFVPGLAGVSYLVDYVESFSDLIAVNNNEVFAIETILTTTADNQWGPFEVFATSDFFNTGEVVISVDAAGATLVSHNPVPEPSGAALMMIGAVALFPVVATRVAV